jgi:hypothetical protein
MHMKKTIFALIICLLFSGCIGFEQQPGKVDYRLGFDGVNVRFNVFPEQDVYSNETFPVQLEIENKGGYDTANLKAVLSYQTGFFSTSIGTPEALINHLNKDLRTVRGRSEAYPEGDFSVLPIIPFKAGTIFLTDYQKFSFIARACYEYRAQATLEACIGPRTGYQSCNFQSLNQGLNLSIGQGSPLAITRVEESIIDLGDKIKPRFNIIVENKNTGQVFRNPPQNVGPMCFGRGIGEQVLDRFDLVLNLSMQYHYDSRLSENSFTCRPIIPKLEGTTANITCILNDEIESRAAYVTPLVVELVYGYTSQDQRELTVRR